MAGIVQSTGKFRGAGVDFVSASFAQLPAVGNSIIAGTSSFAGTGGQNSITVTDNQSNVWANDKQQNTGAFNTFMATALSRAVVTTSAGTFTVRIDLGGNTGNYITSNAVEVSSLFISPVNQSQGNNASGVTTGTTGNTTLTTYPAGIVFALINVNAGGADLGISTPASAGYTSLAIETDGNTYQCFEMSYKLVYTMAAQTASWTFITADISAVIVAYNVHDHKIFLLGCGI